MKSHSPSLSGLPYSAIQEAPSQQKMEAFHVQQRYLAYSCGEKIRIERKHVAHQKAAVGSALNSKSFCVLVTPRRTRS